jgi:hypothetical protein
VAPFACAIANLAAVTALALVLAPGTTLVPSVDERARYIADHLAAWRIGWMVWMVAALTLVWFYLWWRARVNGPHVAVLIALVGIIADWIAEVALIIAGADGHAAVAPAAFFLTGAVANGLYTVAGIVLTLATRLGPIARAYAVLMWAAGAFLSIGAALDAPFITALATMGLFALFIPWCVWLGRRLRNGTVGGTSPSPT